jgi:cystathionine beta-lyase/cystathionine gamma-synthase
MGLPGFWLLKCTPLPPQPVTSNEESRDESDFLTYFRSLVEGLKQELLERSCDFEAHAVKLEAWQSSSSKFSELLVHLSKSKVSATDVSKVIEGYDQLALGKGGLLNAVASVAREYDSMESFWRDVDAQTHGDSRHTYWDTFEHGRRRQLEALLVGMYGSEDALLLNSGMSGIAVICEMLNLQPGETVVTGERSYFETTSFLEQFIAKRGIRVKRVPLGDSNAVRTLLSQAKPRLFLFESVTNAPTVESPEDVSAWIESTPQTLFLIDNSVQSRLTRWFEAISKSNHSRLVVLESGVKYLTHHCMSGILYGTKQGIELARNYARLTGHQLQEKAFNFINEAEIKHLPNKLARHSHNVRTFIETLRPYDRFFSFVRCLDSTSSQRASETIFTKGVGALVFVRLATSKANTSESSNLIHRDLLHQWRKTAKETNIAVGIRCGFGWNQTTARVYESNFLNQPDAPIYLRISIGIEPEWIVRDLAQCLCRAAETLCTNGDAAANEERPQDSAEVSPKATCQRAF